MTGDDTTIGLGVEVAVKLEQIRGTMETGFAKLDGRLDVALTRTTQLETAVADLHAEVESLKRGRWPLPALSVVVAAAALGYSVLGR